MGLDELGLDRILFGCYHEDMEPETAQPDISKSRRFNPRKITFVLLVLLITLIGGYFLFTRIRGPLLKRSPGYWKKQMCVEIRTEEGIGSSQVVGEVIKKSGDILTIDSAEEQALNILIPPNTQILRTNPTDSEAEVREISFEEIVEGDHALVVFSSSSENEEEIGHILVSSFPIFNECE